MAYFRHSLSQHGWWLLSTSSAASALSEKSSNSVDQRGRPCTRSRRVGLRWICRRERWCETDEEARPAAFGVGDRDATPGVVIVSICRNFRAARSQKAMKSRTVTAPPARNPTDPPDFLNICDNSKGSRKGRWFERKSQCELSLSALATRARQATQ